MASHKITTLLQHGFLLVGLLALGVSAFFLSSWYRDEQIIREAVAEHILSRPGTGVFVEEITSWVFQNKGFAKNDGYFLLKSLGPTPKQVLDKGGDCADKSRLLSTILRQYGVDSTLVTLYACEGCGPTHIVVEARYDKGWMVADPVFDMVFPKQEFSYYNVGELKENPALLPNRLDELVQSRGARHPVKQYRRADESYNWAQYFNWDKFSWSAALAKLLSGFGIDLYHLRRPNFLEDPKLFLALVSGAIGVAGLLGWLTAGFVAGRGSRIGQHDGAPATAKAGGSTEHCRNRV
jgi:hypothetical protein